MQKEYIKNLIKYNEKLEKELDLLNEHKDNLANQFFTISSAKSYKMWQSLNKIKKTPKLFIKGITVLIKKGPKDLINKIINKEATSEKINSINDQYQIWFQKNWPTKKSLFKEQKTQKSFKYRPKISIITAIYNTDEKWLKACVESVLNQSYDNWELCLADDNSTKPYIKKYLNKLKKQDSRIKVVFRNKNGHISKASNSALKLATGDFIALLDHDDELAPNALFEVVKLLNDNKKADLIYSDEDKLEIDGRHVDPFFKPNWSPDMFLSTNYLCHLTVIRKDIVDKVGGFRVGFEGSQDYDLFLRVTEQTDQICHIPKILYSWRKIPGSTAAVYSVKNYANDASIKALSQALKRRDIEGKVENGLVEGTFRVKYKIIGNPLISIIIPTKDKLEYLKKCIDSIILKTTYKNYEIIIVDTGSEEKDTLNYLSKIKKNKKIKILNWKKQFNYSAVNNFATKKAKGDYFLFLNNDTEVISPEWIEAMLEHAQRKKVGAVGAKLLYPNNTIQHAGIIIGMGGVANHASLYFSENSFQTFPVSNSKDIIRNFSAVTAACLMISKDKFKKVEGFDEKFRIAFNDVDFCLKLLKDNYYNLYTPYVKLYHHESISVGKPEKGTRDIEEFHSEVKRVQKKWKSIIKKDPYYNPNLNLSLTRNSFDLNI